MRGDSNKQKAREYFGIENDYNMVLHHKDPTLKQNDPERYNQWNIEDLVVMTRSEHSKLHSTGVTQTDSAKEKLSKNNKGKKHYHKDDHNVFIKAEEIPYYESLGYVPGRSNYPKTRTEENKQKLSEAAKVMWERRKIM